MINWVKNKLRSRRLFRDKKQFINSMVNRGAPMKQLEAIHRFWDSDKDEVQRRLKMLSQYGIKPPKNRDYCMKMIEDLKKCQI